MANEVLLTVTEEERQIARELSEYKYQLMVQGELEEARKEGLKSGRTEGLAEGVKAGLKEGLLEGEKLGMKKGAYQTKLETALAFKKMGLSISQIAKGTGLTEEEIKKLKD
ncbi:MAG: hypothetical protein P1P64_00030 [Treponemataceae bacterium]